MEIPGNGATPNPNRRKKNSACTRCRQQKIRCGDQEPACSNCMKAGVDCIKPGADAEASKLYIYHLEQRNQWLEEIVRKVSPESLAAADVQPSTPVQARLDQRLERGHLGSVTPSSTVVSSPTANSSQIGTSQPLAHDVGLLSLANSAEPKYLGPSSGVTFARIIFASAPQSQGLPLAAKIPELDSLARAASDQAAEIVDLPSDDELRYFVDAYFEAWQPVYPFIHEEMFQELIVRVHSRSKERSTDSSLENIDLVQLFLVVALGAKFLEARLSTTFASESFYATALSHIAKLNLHDSIRGVQVLLLLVLSSFSFPNGMNAWFLTSTILACCLDLGLQRKHIDGRFGIHAPTESAELVKLRLLRSGVFWSAYSLDRTLCVVLGRPLTLRDEGIDIEFPGEWDSGEIDCGVTQDLQNLKPNVKRVRLSESPYNVAVYSFRFDRIIAEIKIMLYRVAQSPARFPWPTNFTEWQAQINSACWQILESAQQHGHGLQNRSIRLVELKYHQCLMLLNRPSPAIPLPSSKSLVTCYESAVATIRLISDMARFANLRNTWLHAHTVFISGITMLYCLWTCPEVRKASTLQIFIQQAEACSKLLNSLSKTWSVAGNAQVKFDQLVALTKDSWNSNATSLVPEIAPRPDSLNRVADTSRTLDGLPPGFWDGLDVELDFSVPTNIFVDQLGDMGNWFDLDWLDPSSNL